MAKKDHTYSYQQVVDACKVSFCIRDVCKTLNVPFRGKDATAVKNYISSNDINISHFNRYLNKSNKKPLKDYLLNKYPVDGTQLKLRLINEGIFIHMCYECNRSVWKKDNINVPIPLELHHINGNNIDNTITNLKLLCSNCHALTPNYCGKNRRQSEKKLNKHLNMVSTTKIIWPSKEELTKLVWEKSLIRVAEQLGVDNHTVGERCKKLNIPLPERGYWNRANKTLWPVKEDLNKLIWEKSREKIAKDLGTSGINVTQKCQEWNIDVPPPGYWNRKNI